MRKKLIKRAKGITLIALVVTIIVLLILAGVAINLTVGNNGIFNKAKQTVIVHENGEVYEGLNLKISDYEIGGVEEGSEVDILNKLKSDGYVNEDNSVNVELLTGKSMQTGKGSIGVGDVYVIETTDGTRTASIARTSSIVSSEYVLIYYNKENESKNLGKLFTKTTEISDETPESYFDFNPTTGGIGIKNMTNYYDGVNTFDCSLGLEVITIPKTYKGSPVRKIGMNMPYTTMYGSPGNAYFGMHIKDVRKIVIPDSVVEIGDSSNIDLWRGFF